MTASNPWWRRGRAALLAIAAAAVLWTAERPVASSRAADKSDEAARAAASELDVVPSDGLAVISFHFAEWWNSAAFKASREKIMKEAPKFSDAFTKQVGVAPEEIERVTAVFQSMESGENWLGFITTAKPYDAKKMLAAAASDAAEEKIKDRTLYTNSKGYSVVVLTDRTYAIGSAKELKRYLNHGHAAKEGSLTPALRAAVKHCIAAGLNVPMIAEAARKKTQPQYLPLLKAQSGVLTADLGKDLKAEGVLTFAGELDAKAGEKALHAMVALLETFQTGLREAKVGRTASSAKVTAEAKIDLQKVAPDLVEEVQKARNAAARMSSMNNLKQLAMAMYYNYYDEYRHFPADAVYDKNGKPLLSWRVIVLPYIGQDALYKEFHLDEPWDSDHNKKLLEKMPALFAGGDEQALKNHETHYQTFVGKGSMFDGTRGVRILEVTDGISNTIMIVEAKKAVPWTKPEDVPFDAGKLVPKLGGLIEGIFNVAFADGFVRSVPLTIKEEKLRAFITRNGGEIIETDK